MNFQNMEYFMAAAEAGSITRAAEKLQISQQALSNNIARLEEELGCRLFDRKQRLELTYSGRKYLEAAGRMLDIQKQTVRMLNDISNNERGELRIGISYTRGQAILPLLLPAFTQKYPLAELSVLEDSTRALESRLERGDIDVMIGFAPFMFEGAQYYPLMKEHLCLVIPKDLLRAHFGEDAKQRREAGAGDPEGPVRRVLEDFRRTHDLGIFRDFPFVLLKEGDRIRAIADDAFREAGFQPRIRFETLNTQTAMALSAEGLGITICPELYLESNYIASGGEDSYIRRKVEICPLFDAARSDVIAIGYNKDRYLSRLGEDFIQMSLEKLRN